MLADRRLGVSNGTRSRRFAFPPYAPWRVPFTVPQTEPERLAAGDTWQWTKAVADYPASEGWALSYALTGPTSLTFAATTDGNGYAVAVPATTTKIPAGTYRWASYVTLGAVRHQVDTGILIVEPNLAGLGAGIANESFAVRALRIVEAALEHRLPAGLEEYQVAGKSVKHMSVTELLTARTRLRQEVASERNGGALVTLEAAFVAAR